ncbi:MAG: hypothetical protein RLZZ284_874 [Actinomycetota bacterium]
MSFQFDLATQVQPIGDGRFSAHVHDGWDIGGNANGGYLLALVAAALCGAAGRPLPVALSCHYLAPINDADVVIETSIVKVGKAFTTAVAAMRHGERTIVMASGTLADGFSTGSRVHETRVAPQIPSFGDLVPRDATSAGMPGLMSKLDVRLHPDDVGFALGTPSGRALVRGWCAFRDARPVDALALTLMCDALPPAMFNLSGAPGWVPTVHLSFYLRGIPAPGPIAAEFATNHLRDGMFDEDGLLWDSTGALVAQSRQLALLPR